MSERGCRSVPNITSATKQSHELQTYVLHFFRDDSSSSACERTSKERFDSWVEESVLPVTGELSRLGDDNGGDNTGGDEGMIK